MRSWSLTSRLVGGVLAVVLGCLVLLDAGLVGFTRFEVTERLDNSLQEVSERLQSVITLLPRTPQRSDIAWLPGVGPRTLAYQIIAADGRMILRSQNAPEQVFVSDPQTGFADSTRFRVYVAPPTSQGYRVLVGEPVFHRREAVRRAILLSIGPTLFLLPVMWFLIRWIIRRGMRPLEQLQAAMQSRGSGDLSPIPPLNLPIELASIQNAANTLLARLEDALTAERAFAASAAHELRNPLAALQAQAQILAGSLHHDPKARQRADLIVSRIQGFGKMVEKILQFSRASSGVAFRRTKLDLLPVLELLCRDLDKGETPGGRIRLLRQDCETYPVWGDLDAVGILFRNLLENALLYGTPITPVDILLGANGVVEIRNACTPLPAEVRARLSRPFVRGGSAKPGSGLGLTIARLITRQMEAGFAIPDAGGEGTFIVRLSFRQAGAA
ncbi:HAMP domain-containing protein [Acetobacter sp. TBRC 12305]|uniref:histidine kinase n=2 Tax=Acetobacter garciniae TaxID=2817435 RepID=A0A939HN60_9PROT|nr:histidine kinase dimerization/phospho-acceptor domain-containing protein [Acetobacter garciniae]MBO1326777.1 HAMP domain-containing protein [Acetobacter garciniae]MBX0346529.1 HAMP domain-containing protein [Acetobacter garciniae]